MKLFALKLVALLFFLAVLAHTFLEMGCPVVGGWAEQIEPHLNAFRESTPIVFGEQYLFDLIVIGALLLVSLYAFLPRLPGGGKTINYKGEHGPVTIHLKPLQVTLKKVLRKMPEIAKVKPVVRADKAKEKVSIDVVVVLQAQPKERARKTVDVVHEYVYQTAAKMLGLEDITSISLEVDDIRVDAAKTRDALHQDVLDREYADAEEVNLDAEPSPAAMMVPDTEAPLVPMEEAAPLPEAAPEEPEAPAQAPIEPDYLAAEPAVAEPEPTLAEPEPEEAPSDAAETDTAEPEASAEASEPESGFSVEEEEIPSALPLSDDQSGLTTEDTENTWAQPDTEEEPAAGDDEDSEAKDKW